MRKLLLLCSVLLLISVCAFAQYDSNANSTSKVETKTIQGCLSSSNGQYSLTDSSGNTIWLRGKNTAQLQSSVGHQVQVTGSERQVNAHSATDNRNSQTDAMSKESDPNHNSFLVESVQDTGSACSSSGTQR
ncbi:MAG TPA: hypothetical protein VMT82_03560 [candidate division Zixibacteria bacterium]|nr:hypothetical protein [candidate division Zixibacteria bacterium]